MSFGQSRVAPVSEYATRRVRVSIKKKNSFVSPSLRTKYQDRCTRVYRCVFFFFFCPPHQFAVLNSVAKSEPLLFGIFNIFFFLQISSDSSGGTPTTRHNSRSRDPINNKKCKCTKKYYYRILIVCRRRNVGYTRRVINTSRTEVCQRGDGHGAGPVFLTGKSDGTFSRCDNACRWAVLLPGTKTAARFN